MESNLTLDEKKRQVAVLRAQANIGELEVKILEREADIARMQEHIALQRKRIQEMENG